MTTSPDNNRLDRIEKILETVVATVAQNSQQIEANSRETAELRSAVNSLVQIVELHQTNFEVIVTEMKQMHAEIRGLQTENRRILDHLFGEQGDRE